MNPQKSINKAEKATLNTEEKQTFMELKEGAYSKDALEIIPAGVHTSLQFEKIADVIRKGEAYIVEVHCSRNTIYRMRKTLTNPKASWNTIPDPKDEKKTIARPDAIKEVKFGEVRFKTPDGSKATKNTALYLA
jgi:hypothetical protein